MIYHFRGNSRFTWYMIYIYMIYIFIQNIYVIISDIKQTYKQLITTSIMDTILYIMTFKHCLLLNHIYKLQMYLYCCICQVCSIKTFLKGGFYLDKTPQWSGLWSTETTYMHHFQKSSPCAIPVKKMSTSLYTYRVSRFVFCTKMRRHEDTL